MHKYDEVYRCVGQYVCARAFDSKSGKRGIICIRMGKKKETELPGCKRKER